MKKTIIFGVVVALILIISAVTYLSLNNVFDLGNGTIINETDDVLAFQCSKHFGNDDHDGGSSIKKYSVVVRDDKIYVFSTFLGTTGDNGATVEYIKGIDAADESMLRKKVNKQDFKYAFDFCDSIEKSFDEQHRLTEGMNDEESRNSDGSYKWESYFNDLAGI